LRADVGGVDEGDAGVDRPMDDLDALVVVLGAVFAEHRVAEAQLADRDAGAPERSEFHGGSFLCGGRYRSAVAGTTSSTSRTAFSVRDSR
jgi:hypothetical protein